MATTTIGNRYSVIESLQTVLAAPLRTQTYANLAYLTLAAALGQLYFVGFVTGTALGIGLLITVVGLPILLGTLIATTTAAGIEARLADWLLGVSVPDPEFLATSSLQNGIVLPGDGFFEAVAALVTARSTWLSVALIGVKFVFSLASLVILPTVGAISAVLLAAPFVYNTQTLQITSGFAVGDYTLGPWVVETLPEALAVAVGGLCFDIVAANLVTALARVQALSIAALLGAGRDEPSQMT